MASGEQMEMHTHNITSSYATAAPPNQAGWKDVNIADPNLTDQSGAPLDAPFSSSSAEERSTGDETFEDLFHKVHAHKKRKGPHIQKHGFELPVKWSHLLKRPVVRQWIHEGNLYREKGERLPSRFELFFDLMFVGIAHVVAEGATEDASGFNVLKFVLEYFPTWAYWMDVCVFLNVSGTDDVKERLGLLACMVLLSGYSANASALGIVFGGTPDEVAQHGGYPVDYDPTYANGQMKHCKGGNANCQGVGYYIGGGYWLENGYQEAIHSAIAFYLVLRLFRILLYVYYGWQLPNFRISMWMHAATRTLWSVVYLPIMFVWSAPLIVILMVVGMVLELFNSFIVLYLTRLFNHVMQKWHQSPLYIPALSLEHVMERTTQFVIVVTGEMIISSTFTASRGNYGLSVQFGQSVLGVCCAFMLIWLYYDADSSRTFQHALRRHALTSALYSVLHFPLTAALILAGSSLARMIEDPEDTLDGGYLWFWSGSCCVALACIGTIGLLHRDLDVHGSNLLPRWTRIALRFVVALLVLFLPLMHEDWQTIDFLGVNLAMLFFLVAYETIAKVGAVGRQLDYNSSQLVRRAKASEKARTDPARAQDILEARKALYEMGAVRESSVEKALTSPYHRLYLVQKLPWHPYEGLTLAETGEEDVGMEGELGHLEMKKLSSGQRWAYST